jgi:hypothetical protein
MDFSFDVDRLCFDECLIPRDYDDTDDPGSQSPPCFSFDTLIQPLSPLLSPPPAFHPRSDSLPPPELSPLLEFPRLDCKPLLCKVSARAGPEFDFQAACADRSLTFHPTDLGFLPTPWPDRKRTFGDLVNDFFTRKSSASSRFLHKLYNALTIAELDAAYFGLVGVAWVTDRVFKVDKVRFARLLGIKTIDGSLWHKQGNFPSHGFVEVSPADARRNLTPEQLEGVDFDVVRMVTHEANVFTRGVPPDIDERCRWNGRKKDETALSSL